MLVLPGSQINLPTTCELLCSLLTMLKLSCDRYLYGGLGFGANATGFDDVYILSLPSFQWIRWWEGSGDNPNPHNSLTCNVVNKGQM